ncbi:hypothetical protein L7F22_002451 [Adiantum nelumboides]|nr:hypothetical protein [Adiantum nelumboides]
MFLESKFMKMDGQSKRFVRFHNNAIASTDAYGNFALEVEKTLLQGPPAKKGFRRAVDGYSGKFRFGVARVHSEAYESKKSRIWDPRNNKNLHRWNGLFVLSCLAALFIDPLFYYLPIVNSNVCLEIDKHLAIVITILRSITDIFYLIHMGLQFRTGYIVSSSRILGRGELVKNPGLIAKRYLKGRFFVDLVAVLPLPQIIIWAVIPALAGTTADNTKNALRLIILVQLIPRMYPLTQFGKSVSLVPETAWAGAAYNLLLYMLISHFFGACWYLLAVERQDTCWRFASKNATNFQGQFLDCSSLGNSEREGWNRTITQSLCSQDGDFFNYGIYKDALDHGIVSTKKFVIKYFYCLWWGLRNLSTLGQGLETSSYVGEVVFSISIAIIGLTLFARLIGNMQTYLQSLTVRLEEMRLQRRDMEQWMQHRQLPQEIRDRVHKYEQYKWLETRGVKEKDLVETLPKDLRRDIKRHLCLNLVKGVPLFASMDDRLLDAICERLQPTLFTSGTTVVQEGDPVNEMLFIIRGHLQSETTNGGRTGFLNIGKLKPGDFCGDELLTWALDPKSGGNLPSSTRSVTAKSEVEAFALTAEDLKFVASQFRRLHSKQVQQTFRHYSQQWQTWAACSIQAAWRRYKSRKLAELRRQEEEQNLQTAMQENSPLVSASLGTALFASRFAANAMRGVHRMRSLQAAEEGLSSLKLRKPSEPDFSTEDGD